MVGSTGGYHFMRVISGKKRGKRLETLKGESVRPTTDKVKESIFNVIQFDLSGCKFLDLFAGSGQMGIEALSRGAAHTTFVDGSRSSIGVIKRNLIITGFCENSKVVNMDSVLFLKKQKERFDIAFLDPPYKVGLLEKTLELIPDIINKNGIIICEHPVDEELPGVIKGFILQKEYIYGKIKVSVYRGRDVSMK